MADMLAAMVTRFGAPLEIRRIPVPEPGPGQVLIKVHAVGVCHTDLHAANGDWPSKPELPRIPGHEAVGEIVALGPGVNTVALGDRVGVPWLHEACGHCEFCLGGWETLCPQQKRTGYDVDGGFAEYLVANPNYVAHIPSAMGYVQAAPLVCAGVTVYKGLVMTQARPGDWVAISGIGGLGHLAVQYAKAMGFQVVAVDIDEQKLDLAAKLGSDLTVNAASTDVAGYLQRTVGGVHGVLVTAVGRAAFGQAIAMVRPGATVVLNGIPPGDMSLNIFDLVMRAITLRGSIVGTRSDMAHALALAAQKGIKATIRTARLSDINDIFTDMHSVAIAGRIVIDEFR